MKYEIKNDGKIVYEDSVFYKAKPGDKFLLSDGRHVVTYDNYQSGIHYINNEDSGEGQPIPYRNSGEPCFPLSELPIISKITE